MSLETINARLKELQENIKQTSNLIQRLSRLQPVATPPNGQSQLLTASPEPKTDDLRADLSADIFESLKQYDDDLELLSLDIEESFPSRGSNRTSSLERESARLNAEQVRIGEDLKLARQRFRKAQLQAKRNADLAIRREREEWLASLQTVPAAPDVEVTTDAGLSPNEIRAALFQNRRPRAQNTTSTQEDMLLTSASDLTASLRRTHDLLSSELSRSRFAHETLAESNAALEELNTKYTLLDDVLAKSRGLLGTLVRSQKSDTWYLQTTIYVLLVTIAWLFFRRLLYGPLWLFVWFPISIALRTASWLVGGVYGLVTSRNAGQASIQRSSIPTMSTYSTVYAYIPPTNPTPVYEDEAEGEVYEEIVRRMHEASDAMVGGTVTISEPSGPIVTPVDDTLDQRSSDEVDDSHGDQPEHRRADGQTLPQRNPAKQPANPKKRTWEEQRDEL